MTDTIAQELVRKKCAPCEGGVAPLTAEQIRPMLKGLQGWALEGKGIAKTYKFRNYFETMAFVNAAAWVSHREDHHPDMLVSWGECKVSYWTHAIGGLSENDFICAAKLDALFEL
jgi:4a-hydroxytetrahydrobiopterin dehydratase